MSAGPEKIIYGIAEDFGIELSGYAPLSGGDINQVFRLKTRSKSFVLKLNHARTYPGMFKAEKLGLEKLLAPGVIDVPEPLKTGELDSYSYLLLEYKASGSKVPDFWEIFGNQLAKLHRQTAESFGFEKDNYIGSLPQYNTSKDSAAEFYLEMRLEPQLKMAEEKGYELQVPDSFFRNCEELIPQEAPALVHGDLWGGNFLVNAQGLPCLIDPAVAYAPREMDLAMMKLFGGFEDRLFYAYSETFPLQTGWKERIELWQLYYLLVHLNIFGTPYMSRVQAILSKYS